LSVDQALKEGKGGYNLLDDRPHVGLPNDQIDDIRKTLRGWGLESRRVTVRDYDLEEKLEKARNDIEIARNEAEAAKFNAKRVATETMGTQVEMLSQGFGKTPKQIKNELYSDSALNQKVRDEADDYTTRNQALPKLFRFESKNQGGSSATDVFNNAIALFLHMLKGGGGPSGASEKEEDRPKRTKEQTEKDFREAWDATKPKEKEPED
jgi:hypothetical protein